MRTACALICAVTIIAGTAPAKADPVEDFYRGKSLRMLIGYGPGGGYDLYGRLVAEFLPRFIPGNPVIVPQNMPGAGSFAAAKYMAEAAPKDGTVLGTLAQTLTLDSIVSPTNAIDVAKLSYLGRVTTNVDTGAALPRAGIKSFEDVRQRTYNVGASGGGSTTVVFPLALNSYGGAKFKLVRGYKGTNEILLAMERGEVDIVGAYGLPGIIVSHPGWINKGEATIIYQAALKRHPLLPNVPTLPELATSDEGKVVLHAVASTSEFGRSILTPSGLPAERLAALRKAFAAMLQDKDFLAAAAQRKMIVEAGTGEDLDVLVRETLKLPREVAVKIGKMME